MLKKIIKFVFLITLFNSYNIAQAYFDTVRAFSDYLDKIICPTVGEMVELAPYVNGELFALTNEKTAADAEADHRVIFKYIALCQEAVDFDENNGLAKIAEALKGNSSEKIKLIKGMTLQHVKTHRAIEIALFRPRSRKFTNHFRALFRGCRYYEL